MIDEHERWVPGTKRIPGFSDEASAAVTKEVEHYTTALIAAARRRTQAELVLEPDVRGAIQIMRAPQEGTGGRTREDWLTQIGFLFGGLALGQLDLIIQAGASVPATRVYWLVGYLSAAMGLAIGGAGWTRTRPGVRTETGRGGGSTRTWRSRWPRRR